MARLTLHEMCEAGVTLAPSAPSTLAGRCPFYDDHTPSVSLYPDSGLGGRNRPDCCAAGVRDVIKQTDGLVGLNIHIKEAGPGGSTIRRVCDLLTEHGLTETAYLAPGTESSLQIALEYAPEISRACLVRQGDSSESVAIAERYDCRRIQFSRQVTEAQIRRARGAGLVCNLFWSDEPEEAMRYIRDGIDVILTNCAHTMIAAGLAGLDRHPARRWSLGHGAGPDSVELGHRCD